VGKQKAYYFKMWQQLVQINAAIGAEVFLPATHNMTF